MKKIKKTVLPGKGESAMDKVKIQRVKKKKRKVTTAEKLLAGIGLASNLAGGGGAGQAKPTQRMVSMQAADQSGKTSGIKKKLGEIFGLGIKKAKADEAGLEVWLTTGGTMAYYGSGNVWRVVVNGQENFYDDNGGSVTNLPDEIINQLRNNAVLNPGSPAGLPSAVQELVDGANNGGGNAGISEQRKQQIISQCDTLSYSSLSDNEKAALNDSADALRSSIFSKQTFTPGSIMAWALAMGTSTQLSDSAKSIGFVRYDQNSGAFTKQQEQQTVIVAASLSVSSFEVKKNNQAVENVSLEANKTANISALARLSDGSMSPAVEIQVLDSNNPGGYSNYVSAFADANGLITITAGNPFVNQNSDYFYAQENQGYSATLILHPKAAGADKSFDKIVSVYVSPAVENSGLWQQEDQEIPAYINELAANGLLKNLSQGQKTEVEAYFNSNVGIMPASFIPGSWFAEQLGLGSAIPNSVNGLPAKAVVFGFIFQGGRYESMFRVPGSSTVGTHFTEANYGLRDALKVALISRLGAVGGISALGAIGTTVTYAPIMNSAATAAVSMTAASSTSFSMSSFIAGFTNPVTVVPSVIAATIFIGGSLYSNHKRTQHYKADDVKITNDMMKNIGAVVDIYNSNASPTIEEEQLAHDRTVETVAMLFNATAAYYKLPRSLESQKAYVEGFIRTMDGTLQQRTSALQQGLNNLQVFEEPSGRKGAWVGEQWGMAVVDAGGNAKSETGALVPDSIKNAIKNNSNTTKIPQIEFKGETNHLLGVVAAGGLTEAQKQTLLASVDTQLYGSLTDEEKDFFNDSANVDALRSAILSKQTFTPGSIMAWALGMGAGTALSDSASSLGFIRYDSGSGFFVKDAETLIAIPTTVSLSKTGYNVGEELVLIVRGEANKKVFMAGGRVGSTQIFEQGVTDSQGVYTFRAVLNTADVGNYSETWKVGDTEQTAVAAAAVNFSVTPVAEAGVAAYSFSNANNSSVFRSGDTWRMEITNAQPSTDIFVIGGKKVNGQTPTESFKAGTTDSNGRAILTGTLNDSNIGDWDEIWKVGSTQVGNKLLFQVLPAVSTTPTVTFTNQTTGNNTSLKVGDRWEVRITGQSGAKVFVRGGKNSQADITQMGIIPVSGTLVLTGQAAQTEIGNWSETWKVGDSYEAGTLAGSLNFTISAAAATGTITTVSLPNARVGTAYSQTLLASGLGSTVTWSATGLPAGLTLSAGGLLSGTPTTATPIGIPSSVVVTARDSTGAIATKTLVLAVDSASATTLTPVISALSVQSMAVNTITGGTATLTITGINFNATATQNYVEFINAQGAVSSLSATQSTATSITVVVPASLVVGSYQVKVRNLTDAFTLISNGLNFNITAATTTAAPTLTLSRSAVTVAPGSTEAVIGSIQLANGTISSDFTATSSSSAIATVSVNATTGIITITGVSAGTATITVHPAASGEDKTISVTVTGDTAAASTVSSLSLSRSTVSVAVNASDSSVTAEVRLANGTTSRNVTLIPSDINKVSASVDASGVITIRGLAVGTSTIVVHPSALPISDTSKNQTITVTVTAAGTTDSSLAALQQQIASQQAQISQLIAQLGNNNSGGNALLTQRIADLDAQNRQLLAQLNQKAAQTFGRVEGAVDYSNFKGLQMPAGYQDQTANTPPIQSQGTYKVKKGDTLSSIAKKVYGDSSQWRRLLSANPKSLAKPGNVKTLKIGFELVVPG